jgi:hypothetical protein
MNSFDFISSKRHPNAARLECYHRNQQKLHPQYRATNDRLLRYLILWQLVMSTYFVVGINFAVK